jgi:hypothetical protein
MAQASLDRAEKHLVEDFDEGKPFLLLEHCYRIEHVEFCFGFDYPSFEPKFCFRNEKGKFRVILGLIEFDELINRSIFNLSTFVNNVKEYYILSKGTYRIRLKTKNDHKILIEDYTSKKKVYFTLGFMSEFTGFLEYLQFRLKEMPIIRIAIANFYTYYMENFGSIAVNGRVIKPLGYINDMDYDRLYFEFRVVINLCHCQNILSNDLNDLINDALGIIDKNGETDFSELIDEI